MDLVAARLQTEVYGCGSSTVGHDRTLNSWANPEYTKSLRTVKIHLCVPFLVQKTVLGMSNFPSETGVSGYLLSYDKLDPVCNLCTFWDVGVFRVSLSDAGDAFLEKWLRDPPVLSASPLEGEDDLICKRKSMAVGCLQEGNQRKGLLNFSLSSFVRIKIVWLFFNEVVICLRYIFSC